MHLQSINELQFDDKKIEKKINTFNDLQYFLQGTFHSCYLSVVSILVAVFVAYLNTRFADIKHVVKLDSDIKLN